MRWKVSTAGNVKGGLALDDGILYGANYVARCSRSGPRTASSPGADHPGAQPRAWRAVYLDPAVAFGRV